MAWHDMRRIGKVGLFWHGYKHRMNIPWTMLCNFIDFWKLYNDIPYVHKYKYGIFIFGLGIYF